jgi:hypothetical protein
MRYAAGNEILDLRLAVEVLRGYRRLLVQSSNGDASKGVPANATTSTDPAVATDIHSDRIGSTAATQQDRYSLLTLSTDSACSPTGAVFRGP